MKKLKALKGALIGVFVVAAACCVFAACSSDDDDDEVEVTYTPIDSSSIVDMKLDDSGVKKTYLTYQSFSSEGLEATATRESGAVEVMSASDLDIDYSAFDNTTAGEYAIKVSYVENEYVFNESYTVEVIEEIAGLTVTKDRVDYVIGDADGNGEVDAENTVTTATISLEDLKVYAVTADEDESAGVTAYYDEEAPENDGALESGEYELKFFKGGEEISSLEDLGVGIYTIYAYRDITITGKYSTIQYECGAYILCYVADKLVSIVLNEGVGVFEQDLGSGDVMSGTWTYTLTYGSGTTRQLTADDVEVTNLVITAPTEGDGAVAAVKYTEEYVTSAYRGDATVEVEGGVTYKVVMPVNGATLEYALDVDELVTVAGSSSAKLDSSYFTGNNFFLTYTYGSSDDNKIDGGLSIKDGKLSVLFYGTGSISVSIISTNGTNQSNIALSNENGNYVKGTIDEEDQSIAESEMTGNGGYVYTVTGNVAKTVTWNVTESGTYTLVANVQYTPTGDGDSAVNLNRRTIIKTLEMTDVIAPADSADATSLLTGAEKLSLVDIPDFESEDLGLPQNLTKVACGTCVAGKAKN